MAQQPPQTKYYAPVAATIEGVEGGETEQSSSTRKGFRIAAISFGLLALCGCAAAAAWTSQSTAQTVVNPQQTISKYDLHAHPDSGRRLLESDEMAKKLGEVLLQGQSGVSDTARQEFERNISQKMKAYTALIDEEPRLAKELSFKPLSEAKRQQVMQTVELINNPHVQQLGLKVAQGLAKETSNDRSKLKAVVQTEIANGGKDLQELRPKLAQLQVQRSPEAKAKAMDMAMDFCLSNSSLQEFRNLGSAATSFIEISAEAEEASEGAAEPEAEEEAAALVTTPEKKKEGGLALVPGTDVSIVKFAANLLEAIFSIAHVIVYNILALVPSIHVPQWAKILLSSTKSISGFVTCAIENWGPSPLPKDWAMLMPCLLHLSHIVPVLVESQAGDAAGTTTMQPGEGGIPLEN